MELLLVLLHSSFLLGLLYLYLCAQNTTSIKGQRSHPLFGNLLDFVKNQRRLLDWMSEVIARQPTGTMALIRPGGVLGVITGNPANVEYMLKSKFEKYPKGERLTSHLEDFLGRGIFNSDGDQWKTQRKIASFEFNTKSLRNFVMDTVRHEIEGRLLPLLDHAANTGQTLDLQDTLERFAFDNVCKVAFNEDPMCLAAGASPSIFAAAFDDAATLSTGRLMLLYPFLWKIKRFFNVGSERKLQDAISTVHRFATQIILSRKQKTTAGATVADDLLSRFMASAEDFDFNFLRDIIVSFILAGRDTTSSGLTWFFWLLSSHRGAEESILKEIAAIRSLHWTPGPTFCFDQLREMHYLHAAVSESMRLYPPVPVDTKECAENDTLPDGTAVRRGWFVAYCAYAMGRLEGVWGPDCRQYKPERWLEDGVFRPESPFKYPVFNAGPRTCLGKEMAYIQMKSIAACVLEAFEVEVLGRDVCPEQVMSLTLRMKGGLPVRLRRRPPRE